MGISALAGARRVLDSARRRQACSLQGKLQGKGEKKRGRYAGGRQCISHSLCALPSRRKASQCGLFTRLPAVKRRRSRPSRMEGLGRCCPLGGRRSTDGSGTSGSRRSTAVCSPGGISSTSSTTCSHRAPSRDAACHEASPRPAAPPPAAKSRTSGRAAAYSQPEAVKRRVAVRPAMEQAAGGSASDRRPPRS